MAQEMSSLLSLGPFIVVALLTSRSLKSVFAPRRMALRPFTVPSIDVSRRVVTLVATWWPAVFVCGYLFQTRSLVVYRYLIKETK